ncbi:MAG: hypothetical protein ACTS6H_01640 [Candidatus Hodgkinia cicadicola]
MGNLMFCLNLKKPVSLSLLLQTAMLMLIATQMLKYELTLITNSSQLNEFVRRIVRLVRESCLTCKARLRSRKLTKRRRLFKRCKLTYEIVFLLQPPH